MTSLAPLFTALIQIGVLAAGSALVVFFLLGLAGWFVGRERNRASVTLAEKEREGGRPTAMRPTSVVTSTPLMA